MKFKPWEREATKGLAPHDAEDTVLFWREMDVQPWPGGGQGWPKGYNFTCLCDYKVGGTMDISQKHTILDLIVECPRFHNGVPHVGLRYAVRTLKVVPAFRSKDFAPC